MQSRISEDVKAIHAAAERFLRVFDDLDWEPFRASWASNPTVFFPLGDTPERVTGQAAVEARWRRYFEEERARRPGPPYLNLKPFDIRTERYGDVGLITFTLELTVGGRQLPLSDVRSCSSESVTLGRWPICMRPGRVSHKVLA